MVETTDNIWKSDFLIFIFRKMLKHSPWFRPRETLRIGRNHILCPRGWNHVLYLILEASKKEKLVEICVIASPIRYRSGRGKQKKPLNL